MRSLLLLLVVTLSSAACTTYLAGYDYVPRPVDVELVEGSRVLATVPGLRRAGKSGLEGVDGAALEVQLQVDHNGPGTLVLRPSGLEMTGGNLVRLDSAITDPADGLRVESGESGRLVVFFTLPGRDGGVTADLDGLNLRITAEIDGQSVTRSATFTERYQEPHGGRVRFGVGVGIGL